MLHSLLLQVNSMKELYLLIEEEELNPQQQGDNKTCVGDSWSQNAVRWDVGAVKGPSSMQPRLLEILCSILGLVPPPPQLIN